MNTDAHASSLANLLLRLWRHLGKRRRRQFFWLAALLLVSAFAEVISLGAVLPFLGVLTAPEIVFRQPIVASAARRMGLESAEQIILPIVLIFVAAVLVTGAIRLLWLWASSRLALTVGADLSIDVYRRTLYQPYQVHISRSSSEIISGITNKVGGAVNILSQLLTLISSAVLLVAIMFALLAIDPVVASVAAVGFGASYALITWLARNQVARNSRRIAIEQTQVIKALQEGLGGIRHVLLDGTQSTYCEIYRRADIPLRFAHGSNTFIGGFPRYAMEALGIILIVALAYSLSRQPGGVATALPVMGALALGAQRLLPVLQQTYSAWTSIAGSHASLADAIELLDQPMPEEVAEPAPLPFKDNIRLKDVRFRYSSTGPWVLNGLSLTIAKGSRVGFVGRTGSGKSTTLDILMGLLAPSEGEIWVDGKPVSSGGVRAWQRIIAHVPQSIYLADSTIAENISFGVPRAAIDCARVRLAARQAQIADFIEAQPDGYDASVGERGVRLSGGQRQRIGIARALYKQASVLVFDEATSALDNATEQSVMNAIEGLNRDLTILIIAHRLTTVRHLDTIIELDGGRVVSQGSYAYLVERSPSFRNMVGTEA